MMIFCLALSVVHFHVSMCVGSTHTHICESVDVCVNWITSDVLLQPLTLCVFTLFSVMLKLRSSVAAWIFVLELDALEVNRKTKTPLPPPPHPPFLLSHTGQNSEGLFFPLGLVLLNVNVEIKEEDPQITCFWTLYCFHLCSLYVAVSVDTTESSRLTRLHALLWVMVLL